MSKVLIFILLFSSPMAEAKSRSKKVITKTTKTTKVVKKSKIGLRRKHHATKKIVKRAPPVPPVIEVTLDAYKINEKKHKTYDAFHRKFNTSVNKVVALLPQCVRRHMMRSCVQHLFVVQQWVDAYLQNDKIKSCKVAKIKEDLKGLNDILFSRVWAAQSYPENVIKKIEEVQPQYYESVEDQATILAKKLPSCF